MVKIKSCPSHFFILLFSFYSFSCLALSATIALSATNNSNKPTLRIAVASNFRPAMKKLVPVFMNSHAVTIRWQSASSGAIFNQILHGAPYDLFLSADSEKPQQLIQKKMAFASSLQTYALGKLVWYEPDSDHPSLLNLPEYPIIISIANPKIAPYGKAAAEVLLKLKEKGFVFKKVIVASNILQAFQYVHTGNVRAGLVAYAQIINLKLNNRFWIVPDKWYQPIKQQAVIVQSQHKKIAYQFLEFLRTDSAKKIILEMGYDLPTEKLPLKESNNASR